MEPYIFIWVIGAMFAFGVSLDRITKNGSLEDFSKPQIGFTVLIIIIEMAYIWPVYLGRFWKS